MRQEEKPAANKETGSRGCPAAQKRGVLFTWNDCTDQAGGPG